MRPRVEPGEVPGPAGGLNRTTVPGFGAMKPVSGMAGRHTAVARRESVKRSCYVGELSEAFLDQEVTLMGWVHRRRDHGGVIFIDLRDREGLAQIVCDPDRAETFRTAESLRNEYCIRITGKVRRRPEGTVNDGIRSGQVEVLCHELEVLNPSVTPPFLLDDENLSENTRLTYRVLDLRRPAMQKNLMLRHRVTMAVRRYLDDLGFVDVETPMLTRSTPEGARDYLVPSRVHDGYFYALPQSPQLFKQLLMVAGFDRYYQITKCFRDEDLRADRQPEFTQIDCEMSFVEQEDVLTIFEGMTKYLFQELLGVEVATPFPRMSWQEAMSRYGSDKPDTRFGMEFVELKDTLSGFGFGVFDDAAYIGGICAQGAASYTRKQLDALTDFVKRPQVGASGMVYARVEADDTVKSSVDKFYTQETLQRLAA